MQEDTILGLSFLTSLAARKSVPVPIANGFLAIGAAITGQDIRDCPRNISLLGLDDFDDAGLRKVLQEGLIK